MARIDVKLPFRTAMVDQQVEEYPVVRRHKITILVVGPRVTAAISLWR
jgi:hypothetical protein